MQNAFGAMNYRRFLALLLGFAVMIGPWIWALFAVARNPSQGDAQGAFSLATYSAPITLLLGLVIITFSLRKRK